MRILVGTEQVGGAAALLSVVQEIRRRPQTSVHLLALGPASAFLQSRGMPCHELPAAANGKPTDAGVRQLLRDAGPDVVVSGLVGPKDGLDYRLQRVARELGIATAAVLDAWVHLTERFADPERDDPLAYLPDRLGVPDPLTADELAAAGIPRGRMRVTGHPLIDEIKTREAHAEAVRAELRRTLGIREEEMLIVFFSEPLRWLHEQAGGSGPGYDELDAFALLREGLSRFGRPAALVVKEHPRRPSLGAALAEALGESAAYRILAMEDGLARPEDLLLAADVVAGMLSSLLVFAALLGRLVLVLQPGVRPDAEHNVLTRRGLLPNLASPEDVVDALRSANGPEPGLTAQLRTEFCWDRHPASLAADMALELASGSE